MSDLERIEREAKERHNSALILDSSPMGLALRKERAAVDELLAIAKRFEDAKINWFTECDSCCHLLDSNYELYVRGDKALAAARALRERIVNSNAPNFMFEKVLADTAWLDTPSPSR